MTQKRPLVSLTIPCYNASKTLPLALASVLAQTYNHWEAIIIDDGSTDNISQIVENVHDPRIRFFRFEQNRGRAAARQQALEMARGGYLAMVDADDWIYPWKLERQVDAMEAHPELAVLSAGMAIANNHNEVVGIRTRGTNQNGITKYPPLIKAQTLPFAHAPSIIRMTVAKKTQYRLELHRGQDSDYLLRILSNYISGSSDEVLYTYSELESLTFDKLITSLYYERYRYLAYRQKYPITVFIGYPKLLAKEFAYRIGFSLGLGKKIIARRSQPPTMAQIHEFQRAREIVYNAGKEIFAGTSYEARHSLPPVYLVVE